MLYISNKYLKYSVLFLIVVNIQLLFAQETEDDTAINDANNKNSCENTLPVITNGKFILESDNRAIFVCDNDFLHAWPTVNRYDCSNGNWGYSDLPECLPSCDIENWNNSWTKCVPDCGLRNHLDVLLTSNELQLGDFPHHVGIYFRFKTKDKNDLKYICGGSIISVRLIVTAMYCATLPVTKEEISLDIFDVFVAAGKFYSDYESLLDTNAQKRQVTKLALDHNQFLGKRTEYFRNVAVLVIEEPFIFDNFVQPICVDWGSRYEPTSYNGYVIGWGDNKYKASSNLNVRLVTALFQDKKYVTSKTICTNPDQGCDICVGDIGSGLVAAKNIEGVTKYYIKNIVNGNGLEENVCEGSTTTEYTDFFHGTVYLIRKLKEYPNIVIVNGSSALRRPTSCKVPFISNGMLLISDTPYFSKKRIPNHSVAYIQCNPGTHLYPEFPKYIICWDGKFNRKVPKCSRTCPPLKSETIKFICEINGLTTNCTSPSFEGTIATMLCITDYSNKISDDQYNTAAICRDGVWNQPFLTCQPDCTRIIKYSQVLIYQNISNDPEEKYICGGSIISDNIILSAAQCFTNDSNGEFLNLESFFLYPYLNQSETRKFLDVKIPQEYKGKLSNFTGNLALIKLDKPLLLNTYRIESGVACFEEPLNYLEELKHAKFRSGRIIGKFTPQVHKSLVTNEYKSSFSLDHLTAEVYNVTECIYEVTEDMNTADKFCAGKLFGRSVDSKAINNDGTIVAITNEDTYSSICLTSPGAGFFTLANDGWRLVLQGVASYHTLNKCAEEEEKYLFTALEKYQPFLKSVIEEMLICKIPDIQNSNFTISARSYRINESIPNFSILRVRCHKYFQIFPPFFDSITCNQGIYEKKLPTCIQCGQVRQLNVQNHSTDGASAIEIPWHVEIYHNTIYKCGGTLINSRIVITNSLCFPDTMEEFQISVGKQNIDDQKQKANKTQITFLDEIALITLKYSFILSENVQPVCVDWNDKFGYQEMTSSRPGIGISANIQNKDKKIQKFSDVDSSEVFSQYEKSLLPKNFPAKKIGGPNTCLQDMGSGIAINNKDGVYFLRGIFTPISNKSLTFCTFIKVSYYLSFIINIVENIY